MKLIKIEKFGPGNPILSLIVGTHGDEHTPVEAADELSMSLKKLKLKKSFQIITANQKALKEHKRFIDIDLNSCFPGKSESSKYEEKLAYELRKSTASTVYNFDFHTTKFETDRYALISIYNKDSVKVLEKIGVENCVFVEKESLLKFAQHGIAFEVGKEQTETALKNAIDLMNSILIHFNIISGKSPENVETNIFLIYHFLKKSDFSSFNLKDFRKIKKGKTIGRLKSGKELLAQETFYPIWVNEPQFIRKAKKISFEE